MANAKNTTPETAVVVPEEEKSTDLISTDEETTVAARGEINIAGILESMNDSSKVVSSIVGDDFDARLLLASALTSSEPIEEHLGEVINLTNYVAHEVTFLAKDSGEVVDSVRVVLIDEEGNSYHATSIGLITSLRNLRLAFGELWGERPVPVIVKRVKGNNGFYFFTLNIVK